MSGSADKELRHGAKLLKLVQVTSYNAELRDEQGFVGDRANKRAFQAHLDEWRNRLRGLAEDPLDDVPTTELYRDRRGLEEVLLSGDPQAAGLLIGAIEDYAQELAKVVCRLLEVDGWQQTQRIAAGGGFREGRVGELAIGRASVLLKSLGVTTDLVPINNHPEEAGLIGGSELFPIELLSRYDGFLAVDIGGTNFRAGIMSIMAETEPHHRVRVAARESWRHADERPTRDVAVRKLIDMLGKLLRGALQGSLNLAPNLAIACPGRIAPDGRIVSGAQNLPGNWEARDFNLPQIVRAGLFEKFNWDAQVVLHNDAVVQGLSQVPYMLDFQSWGILTIGTGLGNAHFINRR